MIEVHCPACKKTTITKEENAGKKGKCCCGNMLEIPHTGRNQAIEHVVVGDQIDASINQKLGSRLIAMALISAHNAWTHAKLWLVIAALAGLLIGYWLGKPSWTTIGEIEKTTKLAKYTREQLRNMVIGKTKQQVYELLGKPERTSDDSWTYQLVAHDPIAIRNDYSTTLYFRNDVVERVSP